MTDAQAAKLRALAEAVVTATGDQIMPLPAFATMRDVGERRARLDRALDDFQAAFDENTILALLDERDAMRRERDSAMAAYEAARQDARNLTEKVLPNVRSERDAAMAVLRTALAALDYAADRVFSDDDGDPIGTARKEIRALLSGGGEAGKG